MKLRYKTKKVLIILALFAQLPPPALATDTTIDSAQTTTQGASTPPLNGNDSLTITPSGSISTNEDNTRGIFATGGSNQITNNGAIQTNGNGSGDSGNNADGIFANGGSNSITNNGTIRTQGSRARGIQTRDNNNIIVNNGSIETVFSAGIQTTSQSNLNQIINNGSIRTSGLAANGILAGGSFNSIINSGSIRTTGASTAPGEAAGINARGRSNTITNSGSIISQNGDAIYFLSNNNSLNLLNGSFLGGGLSLGAGTTVSIQTGSSHSKLLTFSGTLSGLPSNGPVPVFFNQTTQQAATIDPTIFASSSDNLADMTSAVSSLTPKRAPGASNTNRLWLNGFGNASAYSAATSTLAFNYEFSGIATGYDLIQNKSSILGIMGGYGKTSNTANSSYTQSFSTSSDGGFAGIYGTQHWRAWSIDYGLYAGLQGFTTTRFINDNTAYAGNSAADAYQQGWWISPELGIKLNAGTLNGWSIIPQAQIRYAHQWLGSYQETGGGTGNASVTARNVAIGQTFLGIGTRKSIDTKIGKQTKLTVEGKAGWIYRGAAGDRSVNVSMIGRSLPLPTEMESRNIVGLSAAIQLDLSSNVSLNIKGDYASGGGMSFFGGGWAGLSIKL
jgi:hypothetical protein